jgi:hypothetical protein
MFTIVFTPVHEAVVDVEEKGIGQIEGKTGLERGNGRGLENGQIQGIGKS